MCMFCSTYPAIISRGILWLKMLTLKSTSKHLSVFPLNCDSEASSCHSASFSSNASLPVLWFGLYSHSECYPLSLQCFWTLLVFFWNLSCLSGFCLNGWGLLSCFDLWLPWHPLSLCVFSLWINIAGLNFYSACSVCTWVKALFLSKIYNIYQLSLQL